MADLVRRDQLQRWKDTSVYPFQGEPGSEPEQAERAVFDAVSAALTPHVSGRKHGARLTLALLRDAIRHDPDNLTVILRAVIALSESDRDALTSLLGETTLPAIIKSAGVVASRRKVLYDLEQLIFDPGTWSAAGARERLHRILERNLWIFGESCRRMKSERGLTEFLRTHLRLEGLPATDARPVTRRDGTDLHLAATIRQHDRTRHLVVGLTAPDVIAGQKELDQLENYGHAIMSGPQFASSRAQWDLILVAGRLDPLALRRISADADDSNLGRFWAPQPGPGHPGVTAYARKWREVIDENMGRLDFITSPHQHDPSVSEGLDYARRKYAQMLPESITVC